jgi:hypothetical protein
MLLLIAGLLLSFPTNSFATVILQNTLPVQTEWTWGNLQPNVVWLPPYQNLSFEPAADFTGSLNVKTNVFGSSIMVFNSISNNCSYGVVGIPVVTGGTAYFSATAFLENPFQNSYNVLQSGLISGFTFVVLLMGFWAVKAVWKAIVAGDTWDE